MTNVLNRDRRRLLAASAAGGLMAGGNLLSIGARAAGKTKINMQLGWLIGGNQLGEIVAKKQGYFEQEGIDFEIQPGGPSIDGVAVVASGRFELGQVSSSPSLMLAVSQGLPIKCFAVGVQKHPYAFFSLKKKPDPQRAGHGRQEDRHPVDRHHPAARRCWPRTRSTRRRSRSCRSAPT